MDYVAIIEHAADGSWGAYVPDLPGVGVAGSSEQEVLELIREAVKFHIEGLLMDDEPVPPPSSRAEVVHVAA